MEQKLMRLTVSISATTRSLGHIRLSYDDFLLDCMGVVDSNDTVRSCGRIKVGAQEDAACRCSRYKTQAIRIRRQATQ